MTSPVKPKDRGPIVWYAVLALVVVVGVVAVIASRGSDDGKKVTGQTAKVVVGEGTTSTTGEGDGAVPSTTVAGATTSAPSGGASAPALARFESSDEDPAVGKTIPTVSGTTLDGDPLTIGPDGKAKVIVFAAHWCPHCQREIPVLVDHLKTTPMPADVELLAVSTAVDASRGNYPPKKWLDSVGWKAPTLADSSDSLAASTFGLSSFPYFVVVDADGKVVYRTSGEIPTEQFDALVKAAQTGQAPT